MPRFFYILFAALLLVSCRHADDPLQRYMDTYPQSQLCDVYKFCFQDFFGLEHLMTDSSAAAAYIEAELANADSTDWQRPPFAYYLIDSNFVRVDINFIRQGRLSVDDMVNAMILSNNGKHADQDALATWRVKWDDIMLRLRSVKPRPLNFEADSAMIQELLDSGHYAMHHSELFNRTYRQHYRIVRRDVFESRLLPLINTPK